MPAYNQEVAKRLLFVVRRSDTAARIGGDEFIVLINAVQNDNDAESVAVKILDAINQPISLKSYLRKWKADRLCGCRYVCH